MAQTSLSLGLTNYLVERLHKRKGRKQTPPRIVGCSLHRSTSVTPLISEQHRNEQCIGCNSENEEGLNVVRDWSVHWSRSMRLAGIAVQGCSRRQSRVWLCFPKGRANKTQSYEVCRIQKMRRVALACLDIP